MLRNQLVFGSVNASLSNFEQAIADLSHARLRWGDHVTGLITHRTKPDGLSDAIGERGADDIKTVVEWSEAA